MISFVEKILHSIQDFTAVCINAFVTKLHLRDTYENNRVLFIGVLALVLVIILFSTILILVRPQKTAISEHRVINPDITQSFILPKEPVMTEDYYLSRPKTDVWSKEEAEKWFTIPDRTMLNQLETDNNRMIKNLLEASP